MCFSNSDDDKKGTMFYEKNKTKRNDSLVLVDLVSAIYMYIVHNLFIP
jgi:hypothetical protein